jgi:hypothetical protein
MIDDDDHRPALLSIGDRMIKGLVELIIGGYARDTSEQVMVATIWKKTVDENPHLIGAMLTAALFQLAQATKWDLVLARPDGTRVALHCDTEEEQTARALEIARSGDPTPITVEQLRGMIWWLATELSTDDVGKGGEAQTYVELAEKFWKLGLQYEERPLRASRGDTLGDKGEN